MTVPGCATIACHGALHRVITLSTDVRRPRSIEEALADCQEALGNEEIDVVPTKELFVDMLTILAKIKHS